MAHNEAVGTNAVHDNATETRNEASGARNKASGANMARDKVVGTGATARAPRVGVIGGGQLARMMQEAAVPLGIELRALVEAADGATGQVVPHSEVGAADDVEAILALAEGVDVLTVEHEHVPDGVLAAADKVVPVRPGASSLAFAQDKLLMRRRLGELGIECPRWFAAKNEEDIVEAVRELGGKAILKTPRDGYDGKGVAEIRLVSQGESRLSEEDARLETSAPIRRWLADAGDEGVLVEEFVPFACEIAQLVARRPGGQTVSWCAVETIQRGGVCSETIAPARVNADVARRAAEIAETVADRLGVVGILAVEMFVDATGRVLVNELAMRPHNSGHWTIEGAVTSQFEQHLRAVLDLPLGATGERAPWTVMVNLLGSQLEDPRDAFSTAMANNPAAKIHIYGKEVRPGRKLGHVTVCGDDLDAVRRQAHEVVEILAGERRGPAAKG